MEVFCWVALPFSLLKNKTERIHENIDFTIYNQSMPQFCHITALIYLTIIKLWLLTKKKKK